MRKTLMNVTKSALVLATVVSLGVGSIYAADIEVIEGEKLEQIEQDNKEKEKVLVIDVRDDDAYEKGHVKHAINIEADDLEENLPRLENYKKMQVVVIAATKEDSAASAQLLLDNGFEKVQNADGVDEFDYQLVTFESILPDELMDEIDDDDVIFIDGRDEKDFNKSAIKGAHHVDSETPEAALEFLPEDKDTEIITYCYSGNRSSVIAEYLEEQGYTNVRNSLDGTKENKDIPLENK
ncbi:rhodanese-like domain-containing protein [Facklamia hominis]|uniref:rhodanese-like domain-containing protein n=1 Tax=Facklamia hominis TaxID=178214 RepID=UPI00101CF6B3|nr:rhodanese-like domain-containing protein [Facklamia hominis]RYC97338.1 rhodanese-like domain-containing protein [Facklamia hominis]